MERDGVHVYIYIYTRICMCIYIHIIHIGICVGGPSKNLAYDTGKSKFYWKNHLIDLIRSWVDTYLCLNSWGIGSQFLARDVRNSNSCAELSPKKNAQGSFIHTHSTGY